MRSRGRREEIEHSAGSATVEETHDRSPEQCPPPGCTPEEYEDCYIVLSHVLYWTSYLMSMFENQIKHDNTYASLWRFECLPCRGYSGNPKSLLGNSPAPLRTQNGLWSVTGSQDLGAYIYGLERL